MAEIIDTITPELNRIAREMANTRPLMAACGKRLEIELRKHFAELDRKPNSMGWPKRHFWNRQVRSKVALTEVTADRAMVTIDSPELVHRIQGGTIRPKRAKTLAIPANAEAYRAGSPREANVDQLDYLPLHQGNLVGALIRRFQTIIKKTKKGYSGKEVGGEVWYWLVRSVTTKPHPEELPDRAILGAHILSEARNVLARILRTR
jgi:phage gpG-like protein